jgi:hypothetical protein
LSSSRRSQDNPIESVELRVKLRLAKGVADQLALKFPEGVVKGGGFEIVFRGKGPSDIEQRAKDLLEALRRVPEKSESI